MAGKFQIFKDNAGEFRFRLKAGNHENIGASEGYKAKSGAENGIKSVKKNAPSDERYETFEGKDGKFYFHLKAANHEIILSSQGYSDKGGAKAGIDAVKRAAPDAETEDLTKI
ncbi:MAG: YegP family protein [Alphaproteobacteria bacterium]|nr:YegP family protein [Alphaproteobacteria bacterium]